MIGLSIARTHGFTRRNNGSARRFDVLTFTRRRLVHLGGIIWAAGLAKALPAQRIEPVIHDSLGVRLVEYKALDQSKVAFRVSSTPYVELGNTWYDARGELDTRQAEFSVGYLSDGTIVVNETTSLKFFSRTGTFVRQVGRAGAGPGDFVATRKVCVLRGDTILVLDNRGTLSIWDRTGRHVRSFADAGLVRGEGCSRDGRVIVTSPASPKRVGRFVIRQDSLVIQRFDGSQKRFLLNMESASTIGPIFYEANVVLGDSGMVIANGKRFEIMRFDVSGRLRQVTRVLEPMPVVSERDWKILIDKRIPIGNPEPLRSKVVARKMAERTAGPPVRYAAFEVLFTDPVGRVWACKPEPRVQCLVFDAAGLFLGSVLFPWNEPEAHARPIQFFGDHVVMRRSDSDGFAHLSFHRLNR